MSNSPHYRGYSQLGEEITKGIPDHKETLDLGVQEKAELGHPEPWMVLRGPNQYPSEMPSMQEKVETYMKSIGDVSEVIMKSFAKGFNMPEDFF